MNKIRFDDSGSNGETARTDAERREELACNGDFAAIFQEILRAKWHEIDLPAAFSQLLRAIDVACRQDPAGFSDQLFGTMLNVAGYLAIRTQYALVAQIAEDDSRVRDRAPSLRIDAMLPALLQIQTHVCEIAQARASTARQWELARQRRLENDSMERRRKRPLKRAKPTNGKPQLPDAGSMGLRSKGANGHTNRLDAILKGHQEVDHETQS